MDILQNKSLWAIDSNFDLVSFFKQKESYLEKESVNNSVGYSKELKTAVLPLQGVIVQKPCSITKWGLGTSCEDFKSWFNAVNKDSSISRIIIDCNSPGGSVYGVQELSEHIRENKSKPVIAVANSLMASAAYWICSSADKIYSTASGEVGSIGVIMTHIDYSEALAKEGIKVSFIKAGKYKSEGNSYQPLNEEAIENYQKSVDRTYSTFVGSVAKGRGVGKNEVINNYGQGRCLDAEQAKQAGMIDGIKTIDEVFSKSGQNLGKMKAELQLIKYKSL